MGSVRVLSEEDVRSCLPMRDCIDAVAEAFVVYADGRAELPAVIHLDVPDHDGEIHIKAGYVHGGAYYAAKFASGFPGNVERGLLPNDGMVCVFDAATGQPAALLLDHGFVTDQRTGAAGGLAARWLAREDATVVAVIGTGLQARYQLDALATVRDFREVRIWGRDPGRALAVVDEMRVRPGQPAVAEYRLARSVEEAVLGADILITCTASREPLVCADWLAPGVHITALGSDGQGKQELDPAILGQADVVVADSIPQCRERGELQHAPDTADVVELGAVVAGTAAGRTDPRQITVADLTGVGVQDVAAASLVVDRAVAAGLGKELAL